MCRAGGNKTRLASEVIKTYATTGGNANLGGPPCQTTADCCKNLQCSGQNCICPPGDICEQAGDNG